MEQFNINDKVSAAFQIDTKNDVVRMDMAIGVASIARPIGKGEKRFAINKKQKWNGGEITIKGIELSDFDMGILLSLMLIGQRSEHHLQNGSDVVGLIPKNAEIDNENLALDLQVLTCNTTFAELREILGMNSRCQKTNDQIWDSIENLATMTISAKMGKRKAFTHLISKGKSEGDKTIKIALNYRITRAIFGEGSYSKIDMNVFKALPRGATRILYVWLCNICIKGNDHKSRYLNNIVETLYDKKMEKMSVDEIKKRRKLVRDGLKMIEAASSNLFSFSIENDLVKMQKCANHGTEVRETRHHDFQQPYILYSQNGG